MEKLKAGVTDWGPESSCSCCETHFRHFTITSLFINQCILKFFDFLLQPALSHTEHGRMQDGTRWKEGRMTDEGWWWGEWGGEGGFINYEDL